MSRVHPRSRHEVPVDRRLGDLRQPTRDAGICCWCSAASALAPYLSVVEMMMRVVKGWLSNAVTNEPMSPSCR